jgi:hypothetical protein
VSESTITPLQVDHGWNEPFVIVVRSCAPRLIELSTLSKKSLWDDGVRIDMLCRSNIRCNRFVVETTE